MSTATANEAGGLSPSPSYRAASVGPLEQKHMRYANYRAVADDSRITPTHRHIAIANGLGWGFDGMDGVIFALISPLIIKEFALTVPQYRTGLQIALLIGIAGLYVWPWLSDRYGRRTLLAVNIALFSLLMPVVALSPTFTVFVIARSIVGFALNGEWSLGSMLVAETWPARLRGRVISINRAAWCFGAALAGAITGIAAAAWGWRVAVMVPGVIALLAIYVRATCPIALLGAHPGSQDARARGTGARRAGGRGGPCLVPQGRQDRHPAGLHARHLARDPGRAVRRLLQHLHLRHGGSLDAPLPVHREGLVDGGIQRLLRRLGHRRILRPVARRLAGRSCRPAGRLHRPPARRRRLPHRLDLHREPPAAVDLGLAWSFGFLGFWGPSTVLTAENFPTRVRGVANGVVWAVAYFVGFVLWPFATVALQQATGSFKLAFLCIPVFMLLMARGVWLCVPEHAGKELNKISV